MKVLVIGTGFGAYAMAPAYVRAGFATEVISPRDEGAIVAALDTRPDLVSVHSPPFLHARDVFAAFDRGLPVLCDKPFGLNAADARRMCDRAKALGIPNFVNFELRFRPSRLKVGQLLAAGVIGRLRHVDWTMFGDGLRMQRYGWLFDAALGGGWIGAYGAHCIDALGFWTGRRVTDCGGLARTEIAEREDRKAIARACTAEDGFSIWLEFDGGITANIDASFSTSVTLPERALLFGEDGAIELVGDRSVLLHRPGRDEERFEFPPPDDGDAYGPAMAVWLTTVREALDTGRPTSPDFDDGLANTEVLDRLKRAVRMAGKADMPRHSDAPQPGL